MKLKKTCAHCGVPFEFDAWEIYKYRDVQGPRHESDRPASFTHVVECPHCGESVEVDPPEKA